MLTSIDLVGEHHLDLCKSGRYLNLFRRARPDHIVLEGTLDHFHIVQENLKKLESLFPLERRLKLRELVCGGYLAAKTYQAEVSGVELHFLDEGVDKVLENLDEQNRRTRNEPEERKRFTSDTFKDASLHDYLMICGIGLKRSYEAVKKELGNWAFEGVYDILKNGSPEDILFFQECLDCTYLLPPDKEDKETHDFYQMNERDQATAELIKGLDGRIVCGSGWNHIFGNHQNLYTRLRDATRSISAQPLVRFHSADEQEGINYSALCSLRLSILKYVHGEFLEQMNSPRP
ncbi:MAG: hypothetical protein WCV90_00250 [Candidatus Woesearchaeota archaeon]